MENNKPKKLHGNTIIPPYTISLPDEEEISTAELLEELDITYQALVARIKNNNFPPPYQKATSGKVAAYKRSEVVAWLKRNGFPVAD